jgi:hypothetical protein
VGVEECLGCEEGRICVGFKNGWGFLKRMKKG